MKKSSRIFSLAFATMLCCCCTSIFANRTISPLNYSSKQQFEQALRNEMEFALKEINKLCDKQKCGWQANYRMQNSSTIRNIMKRCLEECCVLEIEENAPLAPRQYGLLPFKFAYKIGQNCVTSWGW